MATSFDSPALSGVYKLVGLEHDGEIKMRVKLSHDKATYPGPKQVWRLMNDAGKYIQDIVTLNDEAPPDDRGGRALPLLVPVMKAGRVMDDDVAPASGNDDQTASAIRQLRFARLQTAAARAAAELQRLPDSLLALDAESNYPVTFSNRLQEEQAKIKNQRR